MGEVYRARDPRLVRDVAIKVLPESVLTDPARLHRFLDEARSVAALSHPNILAITTSVPATKPNERIKVYGTTLEPRWNNECR
jgi:serine/threonine protein kinase